MFLWILSYLFYSVSSRLGFPAENTQSLATGPAAVAVAARVARVAPAVSPPMRAFTLGDSLSSVSFSHFRRLVFVVQVQKVLCTNSKP